MPISELVSPAIQLAKEGVELNWFQALDLALLDPIYSRDESVRHIFYENGKLKKEGDLIQMPALADFLDFIAREGERGFYFGEIAQVIARDSKSRGGFLTRKDFEDYRVNIMNPLVVSYRDKNIILPNGPSKGGALMAVMLGSIKKGADALPGAIKKTQINASSGGKLKFMMDELYEQHNFRLNPSVTASRGTSHFSILDAKGNAVALTSSIGEGCGYFIPGTAMHLNNMMGELFLLPGGAHSWQPDTRMHSMMTPTMVTDEHHALELVSGSGGAGRIPYAIGQVIYHLYQSKMNLKDSTEHPRVHFQDGKMQIELGFEHTLSKDEIVQWDKKSLYFGGVHSIYKGQKRIEAIGDDRREGAGEVF
jgi:gamma-glutamyltranspeptidase/glutathione hydrolase